MELTKQACGGTTVIKCDGARLDAAVAVQFKEGFRELTATPSERVILDMSAVNFMDSSGLGAVVAVYKLLGEGRSLDLAGLTQTVGRVFRLTRMDSVFRIFPDIETAISGSSGLDASNCA